MSLALLGFATLVTAEDGKTPAPVEMQSFSGFKPWDQNFIDLETGYLWKVGGDTPLNYGMVPVMLSWRSKEFLGMHFDNGSALIVRNRLTMLSQWIETGPENHYFGLMGAPSIEWWNASGAWSLYGQIGGGAGWLDSQGVVGGQGQDFTLNWFAGAGVAVALSETLQVRAGLMFQHLSNGGATTPNPGINSLGATIGLSWAF
ncbi:MAG: acyloxyacyl hydrolase [Prosthecobacter sp.]|nr:acyloxyacyl hydrolase [Prosthecobacter sp.]